MKDLVLPSQGLQLLAELESAGAITETSLTLPPDIPWDRYEALVTMFGQIHRTSAWLLGDALNYGEKVYGETYTQAAVWTGLADQTLANYASTCSRVPRSRRRSALSFSVHSEVAWLEPREQEEWLDKVSSNGWTRSVLREELAPMRAKKQLEESRERRERAAILSGGGMPPEILPPAVTHLCSCLACGRVHRNDIDVEDD